MAGRGRMEPNNAARTQRAVSRRRSGVRADVDAGRERTLCSEPFEARPYRSQTSAGLKGERPRSLIRRGAVLLFGVPHVPAGRA